MIRSLMTAFAIIAVVALAAASVFSTASALSPTASQSPQWQTLERKMSQLQFNSERFSLVSRGFVLGSPNHVDSGEPGHLIRTRYDIAELGEASVSPAEGEVFLGSKRRPARIAIGATLYEHEVLGRGSHRHGRWVRSRSSRESPAARILPFIGGGSSEVDAGGRGSFAGLINLMTTAEGPVSVVGPALVDGQPTTELTATVEPRFLIKHLTVEDVARFKNEPPIEQLDIFVTDAGLPIRVVAKTRTARLSDTTTIEILAVNAAVVVKPPPAGETIARATLRQREQQQKLRARRRSK